MLKSAHGRLSGTFTLQLMLCGAHPGTGIITRLTGDPGGLITGITTTDITTTGITTITDISATATTTDMLTSTTTTITGTEYIQQQCAPTAITADTITPTHVLNSAAKAAQNS